MRFARIMPLLILLLTILSVLHFAHVKNFVVSDKTGGLGAALFAALTFHVNVLEARHGYLPGNWDILWSLSVEEVFYLFFPLFAKFLGRGKLLIVVLVGFVVLGPFARTVFTHNNEVWKEYSYLGGMDAIALGCLTSLLLPRLHFSRRTLWMTCSAGVALLILILGFSIRVEAWGLGHIGVDMTILAIGTCLLIAAATESEWKSPKFARPLLNLGQQSYEIYLTHMFVVFGLFQLFRLAGESMRAVPVLFLAVIAASALLGMVVARYYSKSANRWIRARWSGGKQDAVPRG